MSEDKAEYGYVRPLPVVRVGDNVVAEMPIKKHFAKIAEELDELKEAVIGGYYADCRLFDVAGEEAGLLFDQEKERIAEEAADTITAITTLLESLGIDQKMRNEAQRRVNEKNRERGRL